MSLRVRLLLAVGVVALVALVAADIAVYASFHSSLISGVDATLDAAHAPIVRQLGGGNGPGPGGPPPVAADGSVGGPSGQSASVTTAIAGQFARPPAPGPGAPLALAPGVAALTSEFCLRVGLQLGAGTVVEIRTRSGGVVAHSACAGGSALAPAATPVIAATAPRPRTAGAPPGGVGQAVHFDAASTDGAISYRVSASALGGGDVLVLAAPLTATNHSLSRLLLEELVTSVAALVLAIALGSWFVRVGLRPLGEVERTANAITGGDLSLRVPGEERKTEVGTVALAINTMLRRIEGAFRQRDETEAQLRHSEARLRQFVADASHELRTPIAAVSAYAELFGTGAADPEHRDDLERVMTGIRGETARMGGLVEDLLLLARLDEGRPPQLLPVELVAICSEAIRTAATVGPQWPVTLEAVEPVELDADPARIRQVVDNLLLNVRAHTPTGTPAVVRVRREGEFGVIEVADRGPGFGVDDVEHVFERFYRADRSRSRSSGGSGLGLAIVASIVEGHGGTTSASDDPAGGAIVTVLLPLTHPELAIL